MRQSKNQNKTNDSKEIGIIGPVRMRMQAFILHIAMPWKLDVI